MKTIWKNKTIIPHGERYEINGLNIWDYDWEFKGQSINVIDPLYKEPYLFQVFEIKDGDLIVRFAEGEFSNSIYGIYLEKNLGFDNFEKIKFYFSTSIVASVPNCSFKSEQSGDLDWKWNPSRKVGMALDYHLQRILVTKHIRFGQ
jgi:hypothetical protein